jgi:hypothetical protein
MANTSLVKRYIDYKAAVTRIKHEQREQRKTLLRPFLEDIGRAIDEERSNGATVQEIADTLSNKNRNFVYQAIRAFKSSQIKPDAPRASVVVDTKTDIPEYEQYEEEPEYSVQALHYDKENWNSNVQVVISSVTGPPRAWKFLRDDGIVVDYGDFSTVYGPEFTRKVIAEIESEVANGKET